MNVRLLQLASPSLPVGAFSYSQGLEAAEAGLVSDAPSASRWIGDLLELSMEAMEAPVFLRLADCWASHDHPRAALERAIHRHANRGLRAETLQMATLRTLLRDLGARAHPRSTPWKSSPSAAFALPRRRAHRRARSAHRLVFAWLESQVVAALKSVPLGQTDGQKILLALAHGIPALVERAATAPDDELPTSLPARAAWRHETQYSRIFRS
jgi:urease accessory protein